MIERLVDLPLTVRTFKPLSVSYSSWLPSKLLAPKLGKGSPRWIAYFATSGCFPHRSLGFASTMNADEIDPPKRTAITAKQSGSKMLLEGILRILNTY